jgi:hypothetical protein
MLLNKGFAAILTLMTLPVLFLTISLAVKVFLNSAACSKERQICVLKILSQPDKKGDLSKCLITFKINAGKY